MQRKIVAPHQQFILVLPKLVGLLSQRKACENQCLRPKRHLPGRRLASIPLLVDTHFEKTSSPTVRSQNPSFHAQFHPPTPCFSTFCSASPDVSIALCAFSLGSVITQFGIPTAGSGHQHPGSW